MVGISGGGPHAIADLDMPHTIEIVRVSSSSSEGENSLRSSVRKSSVMALPPTITSA